MCDIQELCVSYQPFLPSVLIRDGKFLECNLNGWMLLWDSRSWIVSPEHTQVTPYYILMSMRTRLFLAKMQTQKIISQTNANALKCEF